ncbi:hypothetical protein HG531_008253 [Fusarium graminearum]|nr:hypothetical protein HG531_008253 [Fusarium graminearum]
MGTLQPPSSALMRARSASHASAVCSFSMISKGLPTVLVLQFLLDHQCISRVLAGRDTSEDATFGENSRHILERMDDDVEFPVDESLLELRCPQALAAKVVKGCVLVAIAGGRHAVDREIMIGESLLQSVDDDLGLGKSKRRLASADVYNAFGILGFGHGEAVN